MSKRWKAIEKALRVEKGPLIAGIDEVGRGPLAGPVIACAVVMPPDQKAIRGVDDSKKLTAAERDRLAERILKAAVSVGIGAASVREIDRVNIYHANVIAMRRALRRLSVKPDHVLLDGKSIRTLEWDHTAIVGGDAKCYSIACASIIAKVTRDRVMHALARRYPGYKWESNVGYSTAAHFQGIAAQGVTPHHRRSFIPIAQLSLDFTGETVIDIAALQALAEQHSESEILSDSPLAPRGAGPSFLGDTSAVAAELPPLA
jgi:ribonuclease HII